MGQEEYQELSSFLKRFIRRFKLLQGIEGICLTAICAVLLFGAGPGIYQLPSSSPTRRSSTASSPASCFSPPSAGRCVAFSAGLSQERAALYIEQKQPKLRNNLINSLQLYPQVAEAEEHSRLFGDHGVGALARDPQTGRGAQDRRIARHTAGFAPAAVCSVF